MAHVMIRANQKLVETIKQEYFSSDCESFEWFFMKRFGRPISKQLRILFESVESEKNLFRSTAEAEVKHRIDYHIRAYGLEFLRQQEASRDFSCCYN